MTEIWTPVRLIGWSADYLRGKGLEQPRLDAELLLAGVLGLRRLDLYLQFDRPLTPEELAAFRERLKRRARREPLQYIEGEASFRKLRLRVDRRVLIPRPETELLVGEVLAWAGARGAAADLSALDLGTGSGAIALALATEGHFSRIIATDLSAEALTLARANAGQVVADVAVEWRLGPDFAPVKDERFDAVVSNPPYVAEHDRPGLQPEVRDWEPAEALFAGGDGLGVLRRVVQGAPAHLQARGLLALEIGADQATMVGDLIHATGAFEAPSVRRDLAGRERIVLAQLQA